MCNWIYDLFKSGISCILLNEVMRSSRVRRSSNKRREGRTTAVHEFNYNFEKLKSKGMWADTEEKG